MNTLNRTGRRLISAAAAAATTLVLFSAVVSISEPQRSVLMAQKQAAPAVALSTSTTVVADAGHE